MTCGPRQQSPHTAPPVPALLDSEPGWGQTGVLRARRVRGPRPEASRPLRGSASLGPGKGPPPRPWAGSQCLLPAPGPLNTRESGPRCPRASGIQAGPGVRVWRGHWQSTQTLAAQGRPCGAPEQGSEARGPRPGRSRVLRPLPSGSLGTEVPAAVSSAESLQPDPCRPPGPAAPPRAGAGLQSWEPRGQTLGLLPGIRGPLGASHALVTGAGRETGHPVCPTWRGPRNDPGLQGSEGGAEWGRGREGGQDGGEGGQKVGGAPRRGRGAGGPVRGTSPALPAHSWVQPSAWHCAPSRAQEEP